MPAPMLAASLSEILAGVQVSDVHPRAVQSVLLDLPGLLFFTTYTLLVLFWAEIYHQVGAVIFRGLDSASFPA